MLPIFVRSDWDDDLSVPLSALYFEVLLVESSDDFSSHELLDRSSVSWTFSRWTVIAVVIITTFPFSTSDGVGWGQLSVRPPLAYAWYDPPQIDLFLLKFSRISEALLLLRPPDDPLDDSPWPWAFGSLPPAVSSTRRLRTVNSSFNLTLYANGL